MSQGELEIPGELRERYRPETLLGAGGFGRVLRCRDLRLDRPVALKLLRGGGLAGDEAQRFDREARVTAGLEHPNIVRVYDHGITGDGTPWIAYELVEGRSLANLRRSDELPDVGVLARMGSEIASALQAIHDAGVVHRDVKPDNVLVRPDGSAVLCDLGLAWRAEGVTVATAEGMLLGTPGYMSPEIFFGEDPSPASDQWAWAAALSELLTGRPVYGSAELSVVVRKAADPEHGFTPEPREVGQRSFMRTLRRALSRDPARRFPSCAALAEALLPLAGPAGATLKLSGAARSSLSERISSVIVERPATSGVTAALALGLVYGWWSGEAPPPPPPPTPRPVTREPPGPVARPAPDLATLTARVDRSLEELRTYMARDLPPAQVEHLTRDKIVFMLAPTLTDPGVVEPVGALLEALDGWMRAAAPGARSAPDGPEEARAGLYVGTVFQLLGRFDKLRRRLAGFERILFGSDQADIYLEKLNLNLDRIRDQVRPIFLEPIPRPSANLLRLRLTLTGTLSPPGHRLVVRGALEEARSRRLPDEETARVLGELITQLRFLRGGAYLEAPEAGARIAEALDLYALLKVSRDVEAAQLPLFFHDYADVLWDARPIPDGARERFERMLTRMEEITDGGAPPPLSQIERMIGRFGQSLAEASPEWRAIKDRAKQLRDRVRRLGRR